MRGCAQDRISQRFLLPCGHQTSLANLHQGFSSRLARCDSARSASFAVDCGVTSSRRWFQEAHFHPPAESASECSANWPAVQLLATRNGNLGKWFLIRVGCGLEEFCRATRLRSNRQPRYLTTILLWAPLALFSPACLSKNAVPKNRPQSLTRCETIAPTVNLLPAPDPIPGPAPWRSMLPDAPVCCAIGQTP